MSDMLFAVRDDLTKIAANAIVRVSNSKQGDAILAAGGRKLRDAVTKYGTPDVGRVIMTEGFDLPSNSVIHTTWPVWRGGSHFESDLVGARPTERSTSSQNWVQQVSCSASFQYQAFMHTS